jgi:hypothetical protein
MIAKWYAASLLIASLLPAGSISLLEDDTLDVSVAQYRTVRFEVPTDMAQDARLIGNLAVSPDTSSVELILFHTDDYERWSLNGSPVDTLDYLSMNSGEFRLDLPGLGRYALVVSNRGNYSPARVILDIDLHFTDTGSGDPLPAAMRLTLILIALGIAAFAIGSVIVKRGRGRKPRD